MITVKANWTWEIIKDNNNKNRVTTFKVFDVINDMFHFLMVFIIVKLLNYIEFIWKAQNDYKYIISHDLRAYFL